MTRPFAKLAVGSGADEKLGLLAELSGLGGMMFLLSIAEAYPYGILPGSPRAYRAAVLPSAILCEQDVAQAINAQVEAGLIVRYEGDGRELVYVLNYHRYQDVAWSKVRPSPYPLPSQWRVPDALQTMIDAGTLSRSKKQFGKYGVTGLCDTKSEALDELPTGAPPVPASATVVPEAPDRHSTATATSTASSTGSTVVPATPQGAGATVADLADTPDDLPPGRRRPARPGDLDPSDNHTILSSYPELRGLIDRLRGNVWSVRQRQDWVLLLGRAARDEHTPVTEDEILEAFETTVPDVADRPQAWLTRLLAQKRQVARESTQRAGSSSGMMPVSDWAAYREQQAAEARRREQQGGVDGDG